VLVAHGLTLPEPQPRSRPERRPWPDWLVWAPNRIWIWDATHFTRTRRVCFAIIDIVSRIIRTSVGGRSGYAVVVVFAGAAVGLRVGDDRYS
jgi:hypothetical protein